MEVCDVGQIYVERDGDRVFDHTKIILRDETGEYFYAKTSQHKFQFSEIEIRSLDIATIPAEHIWPPVDPEFTRAPDPLPPTSYVKRPRLLYYDGGNTTSTKYYDLILTEVKACEILSRHPHPNIAQYLGCIVNNERITGLCFEKYPVTLSQLLKNKTPFSKDSCLQGIEAGVNHMHSLGLVHNDLNLSNIMVDGDNAVIIDFDSCKREGEPLGLKAGVENRDYTMRQNDLDHFKEIQAVMMR
ncbi:hypothetical protein O1611_g2377 [Lasiodiplodia mahajangana]|uniref:Uncharacterized protein n=1 Tax=Lasiodiplodia mahajangana TaxID=1108764 RepID=A0ACC2JV85_9PEZI|nr:hypothetical protein O1611_g2377 [Lasiodiplodia mahajangana]